MYVCWLCVLMMLVDFFLLQSVFMHSAASDIVLTFCVDVLYIFFSFPTMFLSSLPPFQLLRLFFVVLHLPAQIQTH